MERSKEISLRYEALFKQIDELEANLKQLKDSKEEDKEEDDK